MERRPRYQIIGWILLIIVLVGVVAKTARERGGAPVGPPTTTIEQVSN
ncbi:MAG: hypothetical protein ACK4P3_01605 [Fimbriimonadaceae bacterium]